MMSKRTPEHTPEDRCEDEPAGGASTGRAGLPAIADPVGHALEVGTRVLVDPVPGPDEPVTDTGGWVSGVVVDDYADALGAGASGRSWAVLRRWAVALDDGRLAFRDDDRIIADPSASTDGAEPAAESSDGDDAGSDGAETDELH